MVLTTHSMEDRGGPNSNSMVNCNCNRDRNRNKNSSSNIMCIYLYIYIYTYIRTYHLCNGKIIVYGSNIYIPLV